MVGGRSTPHSSSKVAHLLSGHGLYKTMARAGLSLGVLSMSVPPATPVLIATLAALFRWDRLSELSADRASALAMGSAQPVIRTLRMIGDDPPSAFRPNPRLPREPQRAAKQIFESVQKLTRRHPPIPERLEQLEAWGASPEFRAVLEGDYPTRKEKTAPDWSHLERSGKILEDGFRASTEPLGEWVEHTSRRVAAGSASAMRWLQTKMNEPPTR